MTKIENSSAYSLPSNYTRAEQVIFFRSKKPNLASTSTFIHECIYPRAEEVVMRTGWELDNRHCKFKTAMNSERLKFGIGCFTTKKGPMDIFDFSYIRLCCLGK